MSNWKQQIEAQIAGLHKPCKMRKCNTCDRERDYAASSLAALLDVVVAYDRNNNYVRDYIDGDASDDAWNDLQSALDKLREVCDE